MNHPVRTGEGCREEEAEGGVGDSSGLAVKGGRSMAGG